MADKPGIRNERDGNRRTVAWPIDSTNRFTVTYTYNLSQRLSTVGDSDGRTTSFGYEVDLLPKVMTNANGTLTRYSYDNLRLLNVIANDRTNAVPTISVAFLRRSVS